MTDEVPPKKKGGRPPGPVTPEKIAGALRILQRAPLPPREVLAGIGITDPAVFWQALQEAGHVPAGMSLQEFTQAADEARARIEILEAQVVQPPTVQVVRMAPLEDGIDPMDGLFYLADAVRDLARAIQESPLAARKRSRTPTIDTISERMME